MRIRECVVPFLAAALLLAGCGGPGRFTGFRTSDRITIAAELEVPRQARPAPLVLLGHQLHRVADVVVMVRDGTVRGERFSLVAGGYLRAPILDSLTVLAGGSGGFSPLLSRMGTFTVRLTWEFDAFTGGGVSVKRGRMM